MGAITNFMERHYRHFNAAALLDAAKAYRKLVDEGGKMFLAMAGAMSTGELGISLAEMIRQDKIHAISCTGANLEEDIFNLIAHKHYVRIPEYRDLTPRDEKGLLDRHLNRVTDTCIPEEEAMRRVDLALLDEWKKADAKSESLFPHEFIYRMLRGKKLETFYQIDQKDSWVLAACEKNIPIYVPGWADSTLGNIYAAYVKRGVVKKVNTVKGGIEYMLDLVGWYAAESEKSPIGFFQIGGGIAGDFSICVVPLLEQDLQEKHVHKWAYFCQISDSVTSYGSYSGAVPNEKITWGKLGVDTPRFVIESDATIVAPLVFAYVLGL